MVLSEEFFWSSAEITISYIWNEVDEKLDEFIAVFFRAFSPSWTPFPPCIISSLKLNSLQLYALLKYWTHSFLIKKVGKRPGRKNIILLKFRISDDTLHATWVPISPPKNNISGEAILVIHRCLESRAWPDFEPIS